MKIGKYEFNSQQQAEEIIALLDENHINDISIIGNIVLEQAEIDENGQVTKEAILSDKYSLDILWNDTEHENFTPFRIEVEGNGSRSFAGLNYEDYKIQ